MCLARKSLQTVAVRTCCQVHFPQVTESLCKIFEGREREISEHARGERDELCPSAGEERLARVGQSEVLSGTARACRCDCPPWSELATKCFFRFARSPRCARRVVPRRVRNARRPRQTARARCWSRKALVGLALAVSAAMARRARCRDNAPVLELSSMSRCRWSLALLLAAVAACGDRTGLSWPAIVSGIGPADMPHTSAHARIART
jgi:hypothetical protein